MLIEPKTIEEELNVLLGLRIMCIGRAGNMLWLGFGPEIEIDDYRGGTRNVNSYDLHIQCSWRILTTEGILLGNSDFYEPAEELEPDEYSIWEWDIQGNNYFDVVAENLTQEFEGSPILVSAIIAEKFGGFQLHLGDDSVLEVFPNGGCEGEFWRFMDMQDEETPHFVVG